MLESMWRKGNPLTLLVGMQIGTTTIFGEQCGDSLKNWEQNCHMSQQITLLGIHTKETRTERDTCTPMFIAILFMIARIWKQPRCPSTDEWIRKLWYIYTVGYSSAIKMNTSESILMR